MARALPRATTQEVRAQLARFGLDADRAGTKVGALSGGEKARLLLALATRDSPGLLILDEPTNHLDIDAREALVRALAAYSGAVVLISHDPHLIELVADRLWLVANGTVSPFEGDLDDYRALLAERSRPQAGAEAERVITELAAERAALEARLADPRLYEGGGQAAGIARANARLAAIARETAAAEEAWLEAQAALEAAE
jgi:ATP-binding cassette subfamily F protein 3